MRSGSRAVDQLLQGRHVHGTLRLVRVEHAGAVLPAAVLALLIHRERVDDFQEQQCQCPQAYPCWVESNLHGFGCIRTARAHLLVGRRFDRGLRVANRGVRDAVDVLEVALQPPEAAAGEVCDLRVAVIMFGKFAHAPHVTPLRRFTVRLENLRNGKNAFEGLIRPAPVRT